MRQFNSNSIDRITNNWLCPLPPTSSGGPLTVAFHMRRMSSVMLFGFATVCHVAFIGLDSYSSSLSLTVHRAHRSYGTKRNGCCIWWNYLVDIIKKFIGMLMQKMWLSHETAATESCVSVMNSCCASNQLAVWEITNFSTTKTVK